MPPRQNPHLTIIPPFRNPSLPHAPSPRHCPKCPYQLPFNTEEQRDMHYFQHHILHVRKKDHPRSLRVIDLDEGNHSGPLGEGKHFVEPERYLEWEVEEMGVEEGMELEKMRERVVGPAGVAKPLDLNVQVVRDGEGVERRGGAGFRKGKDKDESNGVDSSMESVSVGCLAGVCPKIWGKVSENIVMSPSKGQLRWR